MRYISRTMNIGMALTGARRRARLTQAQLAARMGTSQSVVSRAEGGWVTPSLRYIERLVAATGQPVELESVRIVPRTTTRRSAQARRRARVEAALAGYRFNPWERSPTPAEARSLEADGLTNERFEGARAR